MPEPLTFTVATANVLHGKAPWRPLADIVGWQEADTAAWWAKARKPGFKPTAPAAMAVGITWEPTWEAVDKGVERTHDARRRISPHRYVAWTVLERDGQQVAVVNSHYVSGVRGRGKWPRDWRRTMWTRHHAALCKRVAILRAQGLPVIVLGDFNKPGAEVHIEPLRRLTGSRGIDHVFASDEFGVGEVTYLPALGSDHRPIRVTLTLGKEAPVADDRYELTTHDGKTVDRMTRQALEKAERRLGYPLTVTQGSYNRGGVAQSAGTHDGGGAVDLKAWDWERKVRVLREVGFAAWRRTPAQGNWPEHIHAILIGNEKASAGALHQVAEYRAGRNGLKGRGADDFWRPKVIKPYAYKPPPPPSNVSLLRKDIEQALAVYVPRIPLDDRPAAERMVNRIQAALKDGPTA